MQIARDETLNDARKRVRLRAEDLTWSIAYRARAAALAFAQNFDDWDEINAWFDELARKGAI